MTRVRRLGDQRGQSVIEMAMVLPLLLTGYWMTLLVSGLALGVIFLSFTMVVGEGGMMWLCMATFAGGGAVAAAQLQQNHGFPALLAVFVGGLMMVPIGVVLPTASIVMTFLSPTAAATNGPAR